MTAAREFFTFLRSPFEFSSPSARGCPARECYAQVHHFKWVEGVGERLAERAEMLQRQGAPHWVESARFAEYYRMSGGALNLDDPHLHVAEAEPDYAPWEAVKKIVMNFPRITSPTAT